MKIQVAILLLLNIRLLFATPADRSPVWDGYMLRLRGNALQLQPVDLNRAFDASTLDEVQSYVLQGTWQYSALAPSGSLLASITLDAASNFFLEVADLNTGQALQQRLPATQDSDFGYVVQWSPDSSRLLLNPSSLLEPTQLFDLQTQRLMPIEAEYGLGFQWLPNSTQFVFNGLPACGTDCGVFSDVYLGTYSTQNIDVRPLTRLDINTLNLGGYAPRIDVALGLLTYHPHTGRLYGTMGDDPTSSGGFELLYSVDLQGNVQLEADIGALKPDAIFASQVLRMFYNPSDQALYLVVRTEGTRSNGGHIQTSILRHIPGASTTSIFEFTSPDTTMPINFALSPDGHFLVLGVADVTGLDAGSLVVLDLRQDEIVLQVDDIHPVCQVRWATDSTHVLFGQTQDVPCVRFYENQPVNQLMMMRLATQEITTLYEADQPAFYFLSRGG
jgi:hypothetical protein